MTKVSLNNKFLISFGMLAVFCMLVLRNFGLAPTVFGDEYVQSMHSRFFEPIEFTWPNFLYFRIFSVTSLFGDNYLEAARVLNAFFWAATAIPIFLISRQIVSDSKAVAASLLSIVLPANIYTAFFMPEAMYFFAFWLLILWILRTSDDATTRNLLLTALLFAVASLVKPHILFIIPSLYVLTIYKFWKRDLKKAIATTTIVVLASVSIKLVLGFALAGNAGLTIFGATYSDTAQTATSDPLKLITVLTSGLRLAPAHLLAFALVFGLVAVAASYRSFWQQSGQESRTKGILVLALALLLNLVAASSLFTALVAGINELELINRLHERYYFQIFPFFIILGISLLPKSNVNLVNKGSWKSRFGLAQVLLLGLALASVGFFSTFSIQWVDQPEYFALLATPIIACSWALFSLGNTINWIMSPHRAISLFFIFILPTYLVGSNIYGAQLLSLSRIETIEVGIAEKIKDHKEGKPKVGVVGKNLISSYRLAFELDNPNVVFLHGPQDSVLREVASSKFAVLVFQPDQKYFETEGYSVEEFLGYKIAIRN